jgi:hypothetical protein
MESVETTATATIATTGITRHRIAMGALTVARPVRGRRRRHRNGVTRRAG